MFLMLFQVFAGGVALNLTPCVYPLIPITVSYFGGQAVSEGAPSRKRAAFRALLYVLGLALVNSALGLAAALTGGLMGEALQHPSVLIAVSLIMLLFASSLFGLWELRLPAGLMRAASKSYSGWFGSLFMGLTLGVVAAPCLGPFVLGLLTLVARSGNAWMGFLVFFVLSLGLGAPLFFLAIFSGEIRRIPRSGEWLVWVKKLMGWVLVAMALSFIRPLLTEFVSALLLAVVALGAGVHLGWLMPAESRSRVFGWVRNGMGALCILFAAYTLVNATTRVAGGIQWKPYSDAMEAEARSLGKPVLIDFSAEWCGPCREMERTTFRDDEVVKLSQDFVALRVDMTHKGNPVSMRQAKRFSIQGVPTVIFLRPDGEELERLRSVGYQMPEEFAKLMATAAGK